MNKFVIIGGGTAGWLTALTLNKLLPYSDVTVVASDDIGILGAGEGVTPHFITLMDQLEIPADGIYKEAKAIEKTGITFTNWNNDGTSYSHPFWDGKTALHFDAALLAKHLKGIALDRGVKFVEGIVKTVNSKETTGFITSFDLVGGEHIEANFVFDCSGLHRLLIGKHFGSNWIDYSDVLPCNRAAAFFINHDDNVLPVTESIAMKHGWVWKIPVQGRYGCGYVFDKQYITDEEAIAEIEEVFGKVMIARVFDFKAGCYETPWVKNCIAIGLSSGFTEPLEATSIWLQILSLWHYIAREPSFSKETAVIGWYNEYVVNMNTYMRDFIHAHYLTRRDDTEFWKKFKTMQSPSYVSDIKTMKTVDAMGMDYLKEVYGFKYESPIVPASWSAILDGTK
jgi:tryptophan halogenase